MKRYNTGVFREMIFQKLFHKLNLGILIHVLSWNIHFGYISDYWEETTKSKSTIIWQTIDVIIDNPYLTH